MLQLTTSQGTRISFDRYGSGPPLVLVHGSFTTHETNWEFVKPMLAERFTVHAIARRGRGETDATQSHGIKDEAADVGAVLESINEPVFLLGHSYGAHVALAAATEHEPHIAKLILYEPPSTDLPKPDQLKKLEQLAATGQWDRFATSFFTDTIQVPTEELEEVRNSELWPDIVADAPASLGDIRALNAYDLDLARVGGLNIPVLLQYGSESPQDLFLTEPLSAVLPDVRLEKLIGQAHEGMTTDPEQYAASVCRFLR